MSLTEVKGQQGGAVVPTPAAVVQAATPAQRKQVRDMLAGTFDEERGLYLDAYSDARLAAELNVPEVVVREVREVGFGPLRSVPELDDVRTFLVGLGQRVRSMGEGIKQIEADLTAARAALTVTRDELDQARKRLKDTEQRLGLKAA